MDREGMGLVELLLYFFRESRVVNGGSVTVGVGMEHSVPVEGSGGEGYTQWVKATAWENIKHQPVVVVETNLGVDEDINRFANDRFILTHDTYKLIRALIRGELAATNVVNGKTTNQFGNDGFINVVADGASSGSQAIAWGRASAGRVKLFEANGKLYAIHLQTPVAISRVTLVSAETSKNKVNPKQIIQWLPFGTLSETFPRKPPYLL
jgi:hypothetical protein